MKHALEASLCAAPLKVCLASSSFMLCDDLTLIYVFVIFADLLQAKKQIYLWFTAASDDPDWSM